MILSKNKYKDLLFLLLFVPLIFINTPKQHNWGGDFAQYINQAKCIVEGTPQSETGYIYNNEIPVIGPPAYPVGFSILLTPVYYFFGNNIEVFILYMGILVFILAIVLYFFFKNYMKATFALIATLLIVYNPWVLSFKAYIMSDIPFTIFVFLGFLLWLKKEMNETLKLFLLAILAGILLLFKTIGALFAISIVAYFAYSFIKNKINWENFRIFFKKTSLFFSFLIVFLFTIKLLIPVPKGGSYLDQVHVADLWKSSLFNLNYYINLSFNFFPVDYAASGHSNSFGSGNYLYFFKLFESLSLILRSFLFVALIVGIYKKIISKNYELIDFFLLFYLAFIILWPPTSGFRYLLPVFPILVLFIYKAKDLFSLNLKPFYIGLLIILILPSYFSSAYLLNKPKNVDGAQTKNAEEVFEFIKNKTTKNTVIVFWKPRVSALYAERKSIVHDFSLSFEKLEKKYKIKTTELYYLEDKKLSGRLMYGEKITNFPKETKTKTNIVFSNNRFILYKLKK